MNCDARRNQPAENLSMDEFFLEAPGAEVLDVLDVFYLRDSGEWNETDVSREGCDAAPC